MAVFLGYEFLECKRTSAWASYRYISLWRAPMARVVKKYNFHLHKSTVFGKVNFCMMCVSDARDVPSLYNGAAGYEFMESLWDWRRYQWVICKKFGTLSIYYKLISRCQAWPLNKSFFIKVVNECRALWALKYCFKFKKNLWTLKLFSACERHFSKAFIRITRRIYSY